MSDIVIYTQDWCGFCARAKRLLDQKGAVYQEIDAPNGSSARAESNQRSGRNTVPQIFIGGQHIGGCDDLVALDRTGKLDPMLHAAQGGPVQP